MNHHEWIQVSIIIYDYAKGHIEKQSEQTPHITGLNSEQPLRNKVISMIRDSKSKSSENIANKLKSGTLSANDWWLTLNTVMSKRSNFLPPLDNNGQIITDDTDKVNALNDYF